MPPIFSNFAIYEITVMEILTGFAIPFIGTALGAAIVFMMRGQISQFANRLMLGFASGVMVAACF